MITPKFFGTIKNGKIEHQDADKFNNFVTFAFKEDQEVEISVKKKFKKRTSGQPGEETNFNGYYWMVVVRMVADEMGEIDQDVVHDIIQIEAGNFKMVKVGTHEIKVPKGTSDMSGGEFAEYCSRARIWAGTPGNICDAGMFIPQPHEANY